MTGIPYLDRVEQDLIAAAAQSERRRPGRLIGFAAAFAVTVASFLGVMFLRGEPTPPFGAEEAACEVTVPPNPGFLPPDTHPATPGGDLVWYGSDELWTALQSNGEHGPRKSVWWSANFPGGAIEERPDITVTYERLDAPLAAPVVMGGPGTNAHTAAQGWFMIAGIEPDEPGCWRATADYKGATLSYTYLIED